MSFPDTLRKKSLQEMDWRFLGGVLISLIFLSMLVALGDGTLNFPDPVLTEETASFYVDMILDAEEEVTLEEVEEPETEGLGAATVEEELPEEPAEKEMPEDEPIVEIQERKVAAQKVRKQTIQARAERVRAAQAAAMAATVQLIELTVAVPTGDRTSPGGGPGGTGTATGVGTFGVADLGTDFTVNSDLSNVKRVTSVKASKEDIKSQMAEAKALETKMIEAGIEPGEALEDAQLEVQMSGPSKVEEIAKVTPGRDPDAIQAMITRHSAQIEYCYETELRKNPGLKGKIVVRFIVRVNGSVTRVKVVQSTMGNRNVERCITGVIRRFKFEPVGKEKGNLTYEYPFIFSH